MMKYVIEVVLLMLVGVVFMLFDCYCVKVLLVVDGEGCLIGIVMCVDFMC